MHTLAIRTVAVCVFVLLSAFPGRAEVTFDELVCETKADLTAWKFVGGKTSCLVSCQRSVRKGETDPATCVPPYPPGSTSGCIQSKTGRSNGRICSNCNQDAPECYPEVCSDTTTQLLTQLDDSYFGVIFPAIYCDDSGSPDAVNPLEGRCQDTTAKYLAKYSYGRARCYSRCRLNEAKGVIAAGSCAPPSSDPFVMECTSRLDLKTRLKIDRYCVAPYGDAPECSSHLDGFSWVALMAIAVDGFEPVFYCEN